jgi:hypothetical protein
MAKIKAQILWNVYRKVNQTNNFTEFSLFGGCYYKDKFNLKFKYERQPHLKLWNDFEIIFFVFQSVEAVSVVRGGRDPSVLVAEEDRPRQVQLHLPAGGSQRREEEDWKVRYLLFRNKLYIKC